MHLSFYALTTKIILVSLLPLLHCYTIPVTSECGIPNGKLRSPWILGGTPVDEHSWPWIASLRRMDNNNHFCTGALISNKMIITSAHCFPHIGNSAPDPRSVYAAFGCHQISIYNAKQSSAYVKRIHIHPLYQSPNVYRMSYDLALLELFDGPSDLETARPACLPSIESQLYNGEECVVLGWGKTETLPYSDTLLQATLPIVGASECMSENVWSNSIDKTMLCAGYFGLNRVVGACQGDSGAPLVCKRKGTQWSVYGVVSWGALSCAERPSIFTNVAFMLDWILQTFQLTGEKFEFAKIAPSIDAKVYKEAYPNAVHYNPSQELNFNL